MKHNRVANIEQAREVMRRARVATMTGRRSRHVESAGKRARDLAHVAELEAKLEGWRKFFSVEDARLQSFFPTTVGADARAVPAWLGRGQRPMVFMSADLARVLSLPTVVAEMERLDEADNEERRQLLADIDAMRVAHEQSIKALNLERSRQSERLTKAHAEFQSQLATARGIEGQILQEGIDYDRRLSLAERALGKLGNDDVAALLYEVNFERLACRALRSWTEEGGERTDERVLDHLRALDEVSEEAHALLRSDLASRKIKSRVAEMRARAQIGWCRGMARPT